MKIKVNIPENLNEITLGQYQQWLRITEDKEIDEFLKQKMVKLDTIKIIFSLLIF